MAYSACLVPPGSENMANDHEGSPGTWETLPSPSKCRPETRLTNSRWIHGPVSWAVGDERGTQRWYRQAKETKCGERDVRESQRLIVPSSRGNHPEGPRGGKEAPSHEPLEGNMIGGAIPKRGDFDSTIRSLPATTSDKRVEDPRSAFNFAGKIHLLTTVSGESSVSENLAPDALEN